MQLNIVLRGQSNAGLLLTDGAAAKIAMTVEQYLGFDGATNRVSLIATQFQSSGFNTINYGTPFLTQWLAAKNGDWRNGWRNNTLEEGFINALASLPANQKAAPTAVLFVHNEYDSADASLTPAEFESAVEYDMHQVRGTLGQIAATTPYLFVNIPYGEGSDTGNQSIKQAQQALADTPSLNASIGARANDLDMNWDLPNQRIGSFYGDGHMSSSDANILVDRIARSVADQFAAYAQPGSPVALTLGGVADTGPQVVQAQPVTGHPNQVLATVALDHGARLQPLSSAAALGVGWSLVDNGSVVNATSAALEANGTQILLTFPASVVVDGTDALYFGYGIGRTALPYTSAQSNGFPGEGNAVYDSDGLPMWSSATGVILGTAISAPVPPTVSPPTPPKAIVASGPGILAETSPGRGGTYTAAISAPGLTQIYASVFTRANTQETPWSVVPLNGYGGASVLVTLAQTGDYLNLTNDPANPTILGESTAATVSAPANITGFSSTADAFVLYLSADSLGGTPQFTFTLDGQQLGLPLSVNAAWQGGLGTPQQFALNGVWGAGPHTVDLGFVADPGRTGGAPVLHVSEIAYDQTVLTGPTALTLGDTLHLNFP